MKIGIVGAGVTGLGAAWLLSKSHQVTVFEKNGYPGGHANTVETTDSNGRIVPVDTGFIVYNERTYPNLMGLFAEIEAPVKKTDMSFAVSMDNGRLEYGGSDLKSLFAQKRNYFSPRFYQMLYDLVRFYKKAPLLLENPGKDPLSLGDFLDQGRYSAAFVEDHLLPMAAAIWSCSTETMRDFPAASFVRFFVNHGLFELKDRPQWWTVDGGSREYVSRLISSMAGDVHLARPAQSVRRENGRVFIRDAQGEEQTFDTVIFACHGDQAFSLLQDKSDHEASILSGFKYQPNEAILHTDPGQMPKRHKAWSSWNYLTNYAATKDDTNNEANKRVAVTYWMNQLQSLDPSHPLFVTLNPVSRIDPEKIIDQFAYNHPIFDQAALDSQKKLPSIQGTGGVWYCGSYCGYGFHEDGIASACAVSMALGVVPPWGYQKHDAMRAVLGEESPEAVSARVAAHERKREQTREQDAA